MWPPILPFFFAFISLSCRDNSGSESFVDEIREVSASLRGDYDPSSLVVNIITPDGKRQAVQDASIRNGTLSFSLDNQNLLTKENSLLSEAETIVAMGSQVSSYDDKTFAVARIEVAPKELGDFKGEILYAQFPIELSSADLLTSHKTTVVKSPVSLTRVGYQKVLIKDLSSDLPIKNTSVVAAVNGKFLFTDQFGIQRNVKIWQTFPFRPIATQTDDAGAAILYPLNTSGDSPNFTIIAYAEGYCTYVSSTVFWDTLSTDVPEIKLRPCSNSDESTVGFVANPGEEELVFSASLDSGELADVIHTNRSFTYVRIDSLSPKMRGIKLEFREGLTKTGRINPAISTISLLDESKFDHKFQSEIIVELPVLFIKTQSENGTFAVEVSATDSSLFGDNLKAYVYGKRNKQDLTANFSALTLTGKLTTGTMSGDPSASLTLSLPSCADGESFGVSSLSQDPVFAACSSGSAKFTVGDLSLDPLGTQIGGSITLSVFLRDKYGNTSPDDPPNNEASIFVDYGLPDLESTPLSLGTDVGFTSSSATSGTDSSPYNFPSGILQGGQTDTVILKPSTISSFAFRFTAPKNCKTKGGTDADGISEGNDGIKVFAFRIAGTEAALKNTSYLNCANTASANDWSVTEGDLSFPSSSTDNATFFLQVLDAAGHESTAYEFSIRPCPSNVLSSAGTRLCWQN